MIYVPDDIELGRFKLSVIRAKSINRKVCIEEGLIAKTDRSFDMTPQEQLFVKFFNEEKIAVKDISNLDLRARREEISEIALIARAKLTAIDDEERSRKGTKTIGLERSVNVDDITSNAINQIEKRNQRLSKKEKIAKNLREMGVDESEIENILSARGIRDVIAKSELDTKSAASKERKAANIAKTENPPGRHQKAGFDWDAIIAQAKEQGLKPSEPEPFVLNPFASSAPETVIEAEPEPVTEPIKPTDKEQQPVTEQITEQITEKPNELDFLNGLFQ